MVRLQAGHINVRTKRDKINKPSKSETRNTCKVGGYSCGPGLVANRQSRSIATEEEFMHGHQLIG